MKSKLSKNVKKKRGHGGRRGAEAQNKSIQALSKLKTTLRIEKYIHTSQKTSRAGRAMRRHAVMGGGNGLSTRTTFYPALVNGRAFLLINLPEDEIRLARRTFPLEDLPVVREGTPAPGPSEEAIESDILSRSTDSNLVSRSIVVTESPPNPAPGTSEQKVTPNRRSGRSSFKSLGSPVSSSVNVNTEDKSRSDVGISEKEEGSGTAFQEKPECGVLKRPQVDLNNLTRHIESKKQRKSAIPADVIQQFKSSGTPATTPLRKKSAIKNSVTSRGSLRVGFTKDTNGSTGSSQKSSNSNTTPAQAPSGSSSLGSANKSRPLPNYMKPTVSSANRAVSSITPSQPYSRKSETFIAKATANIPQKRKSESAKTPCRPVAVSAPQRLNTHFRYSSSANPPKLSAPLKAAVKRNITKPSETKSSIPVRSSGYGRREMVPLKATSNLAVSTFSMEEESSSKTASTDELNVTFVIDKMDVE